MLVELYIILDSFILFWVMKKLMAQTQLILTLNFLANVGFMLIEQFKAQ